MAANIISTTGKQPPQSTLSTHFPRCGSRDDNIYFLCLLSTLSLWRGKTLGWLLIIKRLTWLDCRKNKRCEPWLSRCCRASYYVLGNQLSLQSFSFPPYRFPRFIVVGLVIRVSHPPPIITRAFWWVAAIDALGRWVAIFSVDGYVCSYYFFRLSF